MSAAEQQVEGCPLPAAVVLRTESMRIRVAMFWRTESEGAADEDTETSGDAAVYHTEIA